MACGTTYLNGNNISVAADYRAVLQFIYDTFVTNGGWSDEMTTADLSTDTFPAGNGTFGNYFIFGSPEASGLDTVFVKIRVGNYNNTSYKIGIQAGYGYNESTGEINILPTEELVAQAGATTGTASFPCDFYIADGAFVISIFSAAGSNKQIVIHGERVRNDSNEIVNGFAVRSRNSSSSVYTTSQVTSKEKNRVYPVFTEGNGYAATSVGSNTALRDNDFCIGNIFYCDNKFRKFETLAVGQLALLPYGTNILGAVFDNEYNYKSIGDGPTGTGVSTSVTLMRFE